MHISNVMLVIAGAPTRVGRKLEGDKLVRYAKKNGEVIE
jgi:large subunit ribosomal protein L24